MCSRDDLVTAAATTSLLVARGKTSAELNFLGSLLMLVGQILSTMADVREFSCDNTMLNEIEKS
ncbi:MAG: hypothetical protein ACOX6P_10140 [Candidatus Merdivicinus sp.]|jgi:hypothetical protein